MEEGYKVPWQHCKHAWHEQWGVNVIQDILTARKLNHASFSLHTDDDVYISSLRNMKLIRERKMVGMCSYRSQESRQDRWGCVDSLSFCKRFMMRDRWPRAVISRSFFNKLLSRVRRHSPSTAFSLKMSVNLPRLSLHSHWHTSSTVQLVMFAGFSLEREAVGLAAVCVCVCVCVSVTERERERETDEELSSNTN